MTFEDPIYYRNQNDLVAVSLDGGETVLTPTGRQLPVTGTIWEESDEDLRKDLNDNQQAM